MMDVAALRGRRVLITGHTGFKGTWLSIWLEALGARVIGVALDPEDEAGFYTSSCIGDHIIDHRFDIRDRERLQRVFTEEQPEVVLHLAAQALVLEGYREPAGTFEVNTMGTVNVLEAIRHTPSVKAAVIVTTDKCYENHEWVHGYRETDAMGGHDPYSASKGAAEVVVSSYRRSFFSTAGATGIATARSGNVVGGGDRSRDRIVPDIVHAWERGVPLHVRHPDAVRPWLHVLEPLHGYLRLAVALLDDPVRYAGAWNFGPLPTGLHPVRTVVSTLLSELGGGEWMEVGAGPRPHEAALLMLDINKAVQHLGWAPRFTFQETMRWTAEWYMQARDREILGLCREQIKAYMAHEGR